MHGLIHILQDVRKFGPLDCSSSFKYENYLQTFKKLFKKPDKPLEQIVRKFIEYEQQKINKSEESETTCSQFVTDFKSTHTEGPLIEGCCGSQYQIMRCANTIIRIDKLANNCCGLADGNITEVKNIAYSIELNKKVIIGNEFCHRKNLYDVLCPSSPIGVFIG